MNEQKGTISAPEFVAISVEHKSVDLLSPYAKGGKIGEMFDASAERIPFETGNLTEYFDFLYFQVYSAIQ